MAGSTPSPRPGELYQHCSGFLYRIDALSVVGTEQSPAIVYSTLDAAPDAPRHVGRACAFNRTVLDASGNERPRFVRVRMPDPAAFEYFAYGHCSLPTHLVDAVIARYGDPGRFYHAAWHVHDLFERAVQSGMQLTNAQVMAILFHDAVYVPGAPHGVNERMSALLLRQWAQHDCSGDLLCACQIIEDTADRVPRSAGSEQVIGLDLASLADCAANFDAYTEMVWLEERHLFGSAHDAKPTFLRERFDKLSRLAETIDRRMMRPGFGLAFGLNRERLMRQVDSLEPG